MATTRSVGPAIAARSLNTEAVVMALMAGALAAPYGCGGHRDPHPAAGVPEASRSPVSPQGPSLLIQASNLRYVGAFRVPAGSWGRSSFEYGGTALALGRGGESLYIVGHPHQQMTAEISIPPLVNSTSLSALNEATVVQPFTEASEGLMASVREGDVFVGGLLARDGRLYGSAYSYYDAEGSQVLSHFFRRDNLAVRGSVSGMFRVGNVPAGFVSGYIADIPPEWQPQLGGTAITGQCCIPIISRTSAGPAAFAFEPRDLGAINPAPAQPLVYYPLDEPLAREDTQNAVFNTTTEIGGVVLVPATRSLLFFGSHGIGRWCYGTGSQCGDRIRPEQGPHAPPYVYQVWAYDVAELLQVRNGRKRPWEVRPYGVWTLDFPFPENVKRIGGVAFNAQARRLYISQQWADAPFALPVIHGLDIIN